MDLLANCVSNVHDLGPFAFLFSSTAAVPRIFSTLADKLLPDNGFDLLQVFATSAFVIFNLSRRSHDGDGCKSTLLSVWNTAMHESNAMCIVRQRTHPMIDRHTDPNPSVPRGNPQSSSFEEVAYIKTKPERTHWKAQS